MKVCFLFLSVLCLCASSAFGDQKIDPWVLKATENGKVAEFLVILKEQADLSPVATLHSRADRGRFVFAMLRDAAERGQAPLRMQLSKRGIPFRSFHIVNALLVQGDRLLAEELAARPDVARVEGNPRIVNALPDQELEASTLAAVEENVLLTGAPSLWAIGHTGVGIVIGGADTGYRWTHNSLKNHYRGWNGTMADHDYNWHDAIHSSAGACGADSTEPCDDNGHGSHTMGIALGDDGAGNQIGMAPDAKWIGCRNMNGGVGSPATYLECFEFFLAPYPVGGTPDQGDPSLAPDITTNSWGCPIGEGCSALTLEAAVDAQKSAGIMTIVAAGNDGPQCSTIDAPPTIYDSSYTVGATQINDDIYVNSGRGAADTTNLIKPNIVAPGVGVRSADDSADNVYITRTGTSMAAPHVAGAVALLWSAIPELKNDQESTEGALNSSAVRLTSIVEACGGDYVDGPNNTWGKGRLDIAAAYNQVCTPSVPNGLTVETVDNDQVDIDWNASPGAVSYEVYRGDGSCPGTSVALLSSPTSNHFSDTTVVPGSAYSYFIKARRDDCVSAVSTCVDTSVVACVFCDDFENSTRSEDWTYDKGSWEEKDGELQGTPTKRKAIAIAAPAFAGCQLCTIRAVLALTGTVGTRGGIIAWHVAKTHSVELLLKEATNTWVLKQRVDRRIVAKAKAQHSIVPGTFYTVVLSHDGSAIHLEVDGELLLSFTPAVPLPSGTVGFFTRGAAARFESIEVF